ncbi:alkylmercury lyase family protein [Nocardia sputi]|uniref:alkylmercury lyase family protein n=1 Tax=Nocardia sputi TaxID=2943705 RepID=UPI0020C07F55|nr:alkylmercury lyase family protein [Nocardia sputi]
MRLDILQVPDCPNVAVLEQRLHEATAGQPITPEITHHIIDDPEQAASAGMTGSPTLLIDDRDPFATPGYAPSLSCRLYPQEDGGLDGAPSVTALRAALRSNSADGGQPTDDAQTGCCSPSAADSAAALSIWRAAAQPADPTEKAVHQDILRFFATSGRAPTAAQLAETRAVHAVPIEQVLRHLHDADVIRTDTDGLIVAAYPFSAAPTPHRVRIAGGPTVSAMCAVDALGIGAMLGTQVIITTTDPVTSDPITITADNQLATAQPATTVVFVGAQAGLGPSAETCCSHLNFFTERRTAQKWADDHPGVDGDIVELPDAHHLGTAIFGHLLEPSSSPRLPHTPDTPI